MKQCRPLAQALVEEKSGTDNAKCKDIVKREEKQKKKRNQDKCMSRCEDSPEYIWMYADVRDKEYKDLHICREKTGSDGMGWFAPFLFQKNFYSTHSSKSQDRIFP